MKQQPLSTIGRIYLTSVIIAGLAVTGYSVVQLYLSPAPSEWVILAGLTLLTGSFTVKVPSLTARISVSEAFVFTAVILFGPPVATVIVALDSFVISLWMRRSHRSAVRSLFNLSAVALAMWLASHAFFALVQASPGSGDYLALDKLALPLFVLAAFYFLWNSWLVAFAVAAERHVHPYVFWRDNFPWLSLNYFGGASVAGLLVAYTRSVDIRALGVIIPLLVISYLTYRTSIGRVEDARQHIEQVNTLYMSTIETLAMAVDAKDQITHGHIRRVQVYAIELAKRLGLADERQLKAIEAAALLHDMGKLAIPEHILNKPGKLSVAEFEKMKRHADIGADLLSSIPFPYPVVPIVRHHHESWNGSGYPNGIAGTDIPLGARILSVVDCFDALTSDRPYRPRLSAEAAFSILRERSGSMYDPLVVDAFIAEYSAIAPLAIKAGEQARSIFGPRSEGTPEPVSAFDEIHSNSAEAAILFEASRNLTRCRSVAEALSAIFQCVRQSMPAQVVAYYEYLPQSDSLRASHVFGENASAIAEVEIPNGERTTGWAAANHRSILNSSAALDLGWIRNSFLPPLKTALSVPVASGPLLTGVLTVYSGLADPFTEEHRYMTEQLASLLGARLPSLMEANRTVVPFRDSARNPSARR